MGKQRFWAVKMTEIKGYGGGFGLTWDNIHPEDKRKEKSVLVYAIYPKKKDAIDDVKFRGGSKVCEVEIKIL